METKYTQGPWIINYPDVNKYNAPFKIGNEEFEGNIYNPLCEVSTDELYFDLDESEANAKLIAAAPNLIENLQRLLDRLNETDLAENFPSAVRRAEEAIRKATE